MLRITITEEDVHLPTLKSPDFNPLARAILRQTDIQDIEIYPNYAIVNNREFYLYDVVTKFMTNLQNGILPPLPYTLGLDIPGNLVLSSSKAD